ncbi:hypothetical protein GCM10017744_043410 [Streptomyces antimycoticus]
MDWRQLRHSTLSRPDALAVGLERLILSGELPPGSRVPPERELAESLGVSRGSVREALRALASRGLVARRPGSGTVVLDRGPPPTATSSPRGSTPRRSCCRSWRCARVSSPR